MESNGKLWKSTHAWWQVATFYWVGLGEEKFAPSPKICPRIFGFGDFWPLSADAASTCSSCSSLSLSCSDWPFNVCPKILSHSLTHNYCGNSLSLSPSLSLSLTHTHTLSHCDLPSRHCPSMHTSINSFSPSPLLLHLRSHFHDSAQLKGEKKIWHFLSREIFVPLDPVRFQFVKISQLRAMFDFVLKGANASSQLEKEIGSELFPPNEHFFGLVNVSTNFKRTRFWRNVDENPKLETSSGRFFEGVATFVFGCRLNRDAL